MKDVDLKLDGRVNSSISVDTFENSKSGICATESVMGEYEEIEDFENIHFINIAKCVPNKSKSWKNFQSSSLNNTKICFTGNIQKTTNTDYEKFDLLVESPNAVGKSSVLFKQNGTIIFQFNDSNKSQIKILPNGKIDIKNSNHNLLELLRDSLTKIESICQSISQITVTVSALNVPTPINNASDFVLLKSQIQTIKASLETFIS